MNTKGKYAVELQKSIDSFKMNHFCGFSLLARLLYRANVAMTSSVKDLQDSEHINKVFLN